MANLSATLSRTLQSATNPILAAIGSLALGTFLGFLVFAYVAQNGLADIGTLTSILALLGGAAAFGFLAKLADADTPTGNVIAMYLLGVVIGAALFVGTDVAGYADDLFPGCDCPTPSPTSS
ncbi:MAG: hypothetical protein ACXWZ8_11120 [Gaiellaceae bacterium]